MAQDPLHLLCIEPRFPGRLGPVADWLVRRRGYRCQFYHSAAEAPERWPESVGRGLELIQFNVGGAAREASVPWTRLLERGLCYAYGCWEVLEARRPRPVDLVLGHSSGLGSSLFVPVLWPGVPIVNLFGYFFHAHAHDLAGEAGADMPAAYFHWRRAANAMDLLDLENGVTPWTLTRWQRGLYPAEYRDDFLVLFDGVDTRRFARPERAARRVAGRPISPQARVVSCVALALDRLRGLDRFMELANRLQRTCADVLCIVVGGSLVQRGLDVQFYGQDYRAHVLARNPPHDPERLWFLDTVPQAVVAELLGATDLHVYPGRPYPVSRSLLEAMSAGAVVLAADTEPVREFITDGRTGLLVPADDPDAWERQARAVLDDPAGHLPLGTAAAALVREHYTQDVTLPVLAEHFSRLVERGPGLFLPELLDCPMVNYCEYYFTPSRRDLTYRIDLPPAEPAPFYPRCINAATLINLVAYDAGYAPTEWQRQSFPERFRHKIEVHFDGIDTDLYRPRRVPRVVAGHSLSPDTRVVTFVARGLESMRGFDLFMRFAQRIGRARSDVLFVVVGREESYYSWDLLHTGQPSFKQWVLSQGDYDLSRFVFLHHLEPEQLSELLCLSDLHLYLTVPFVLSWSLMDALACGCVVLASDVPPVREVIEPDRTGLIRPLFDTEELVEAALRVLDDPAGFAPLGRAARALMEEKYSLDVAVPELKDYFERCCS
jgi:glycosyltransferase involved in cell wall biosynthesis